MSVPEWCHKIWPTIKTLVWSIVFAIFSLIVSVLLFLYCEISMDQKRPELGALADLACASSSAFFAGLFALCLLYGVVWYLIGCLRRKGGTSFQPDGVKAIALSEYIAAIEQALFYFAAIAGLKVFGIAVGGWLVFKVVNKYALWKRPETEPKELPEWATPEEKVKWAIAKDDYDYKAAQAHNRFQIFAIGTAMSIAASGIAGTVFHCALYAIKHICRA
jgi:hypothetical protein